MLRSSALTMPVVALPERPKGLPIATTPSPTCTFDESPNVSGRSSEVGTDTRITAMSLDDPVPPGSPTPCVRWRTRTRIEPPPSTTWAFINMSPRLSITNLEPSALGAGLRDGDIDDARSRPAVDLVA